MNTFNRILFISLFTLFLGCGTDNFPEQSELKGLRVLAISADTPEINAVATTVTLTPLISFVDGGSTTLDYSWVACPDPGLDFGADISCDSSPAALKESGSGTVNMGTLSGTFFTGNAPTIAVPISASLSAYFSSLDSDLQFNGMDYIVLLNYKDQNSEANIESLKRIKISSKAPGDLNLNPTFTGILFNKSPMSSYPITKGDLTISSPSVAETYTKITNIGTKSFNENMYISWFSSTGEFLFNRTDVDEDNEFKPKGSSGVFVAVFRDGRGGVNSILVSF
jgi:hypothetical protein